MQRPILQRPTSGLFPRLRYMSLYVRMWWDGFRFQNAACAFAGAIFGHLLGKRHRQYRIDNVYADCLTVTSYELPQTQAEKFEETWNQYSKFAQKFTGYEWTKMFKAIKWDKSPFSYLELRLWRNDNIYKEFAKQEAIAEQKKKLEEGGVKVKTHMYEIIVDDSIRRMIE
eukprot:GDKI01006631.1.p1 GENE.GDKI01006631.1~~GDKI01006631.1.p1  ORF type:complete len:170 (-),score=23.63 GDKI01006631.1:444-953(-)